MRRIALTGSILSALVLLALTPSALAKDGDVVKSGTCTATSTWKLKLGREDGAIQVEFEVDQNQVGDSWRVRILDNGVLAFKKTFVTAAPSGSFEARTVIPNGAGPDAVKARAENQRTGEVCIGRATF